jgi:hypothetical protein
MFQLKLLLLINLYVAVRLVFFLNRKQPLSFLLRELILNMSFLRLGIFYAANHAIKTAMALAKK